MAATAERSEQVTSNPALNADASANLYADARNNIPVSREKQQSAQTASHGSPEQATPAAASGDNGAGKQASANTTDSANSNHITVHEGQILSQIAQDVLGKGASRRDIYNYVDQIAKTNHLESANSIYDKQDLIIPEFKDPHKAAGRDSSQQDEKAAKGDTELSEADKAKKAQEIYTQLNKAFPTGNDLMSFFGKDQNGTITPTEISQKMKELQPRLYANENPTFDKALALQDLNAALELVPDKNLTAERYDQFLSSLKAPQAQAEKAPPAADTSGPVNDNQGGTNTDATVDPSKANAERAAQMSAVFPSGADLMKAFGLNATDSLTTANIDAAIQQLTPDMYSASNSTFAEVQALNTLRGSIDSPRTAINAAYYDTLLQSLKPQQAAAPAEETIPTKIDTLTPPESIFPSSTNA